MKINLIILTLTLSLLAIAPALGIFIADQYAYKKNYEEIPNTEQILNDAFATNPLASYHSIKCVTFPKKDVCVYAIQSVDQIYLVTYTYNLIRPFNYKWEFKGVNL